MQRATGTAVIVLAAGEGTRMKSSLHKVLFPICGRPMVDYVLDAAGSLGPERIVVVVGHKGEEVKDTILRAWPGAQDTVRFAWQHQRLGTAHAVMSARESLPEGDPDVLIMYGDTPLVTGDLLLRFVQSHERSGAPISVMTATPQDPGPYGRIVRNDEGHVVRIVEARDLRPEERHLSEVNAGIYYCRASLLYSLLERVDNNNAKGEYYLTDIIRLASEAGLPVNGFYCDDFSLVQGINDRWELAAAESIKRESILRDLAISGVTVRDPESTYVDFGVKVGPGTVLEPNTYLRGETSIAEDCVIGPGTELFDTKVGRGSKVWMSVVENSDVGEEVQIGPFSHIRPNTTLEKNVLVGNFAEIKNSVIGSGTKVHHHSYLGDSDVGQGVNIGAGTVTVNYDGIRKFRTIIQDGAFIGCNANLIAPVTIGKGAYIAAGSTITDDVPERSLAIARERQVVKEGWVDRRKQN
ncbi:MAG TPA: bifunctional UDP-N-acetylglucosamine diphosphorylase/glucosamine-1-phosphate N-acetyltransferase GlmU [Firmicutes bacterium]|nr:bifunctional UDP-N-acetylglucosamine diphosphorylase/glucosamine-1-phosphate N-acetyltransferase GlmU [Candidatus Fermentithermobacillaceae bacterium]